MAGESNFSASAGVVKRKAEAALPLPCGGLEGEVEWGWIPDFHGASLSWIPAGAAAPAGGPRLCPPLEVLPGGDVCVPLGAASSAALTASFAKLAFWNLAILSTID